jgi:DNA-directed RNA polymerase subunit beta'
LLLDKSPRDLERIIYFAAYLVTEVDAEAKQARIRQLYQEMEDELADLDAEEREGIEELDEGLRGDLENLSSGHAGVTQDVTARREGLVQAAAAEFERARAELGALLGGSAERDYAYFDTPIVREGEMINEDRLETLDREHDERLARIEAEAEHERARRRR